MIRRGHSRLGLGTVLAASALALCAGPAWPRISPVPNVPDPAPRLEAAARGGPPVIGSALGVQTVRGRRVVVDVLAAGPDAATASANARRAVRKLGARAPAPGELARLAPSKLAATAAGAIRDIVPRTPLIGIVWPQFANGSEGGPSLPWSYNPSGDPTGSGESIVRRSLRDWSGIRGSAYANSYLGATTRCPPDQCGEFEPDGFNDIRWSDFGAESPVGVALFGFDDDDALIEVDVVLNTHFPQWTTDGTGADVESVIVHELGHAAGLAHSAEGQSVMRPLQILGDVDRTPSALDRAAVVHLYPADPEDPARGPVLPAPPSVDADLVAALGQPAPLGGRLSTYFQIGGLNESGQVALVSEIAVGGQSRGDGVFRARDGTLREVARPGRQVPGAGTLDNFELGNLGINGRGDIAFAYQLGQNDGIFGEGAGLFLAPGVGGPLRVLLTPGAPAGSDTLLGAAEADLNDSGQVVFEAPFPTPAAPIAGLPGVGVFSAERGRPVRPIARAGDPAFFFGPDEFTPLASAINPSVNAGGDVAFDGIDEYTPGEGCPIGFFTIPFCDGRTYIRRAGNEQLDQFQIGFESFGLLPGLPQVAWGRSFGPDVDDDGNILVGHTPTTLDNRPINDGPILTRGLYRYDTGGVRRRVIQPGDPLPGGGHHYTQGVFHSLPPWRINDDSDVAFVGMLDTDPVPPEGRLEGLYVRDGATLRLVARDGSQVPGVGQIAHVLGGDPDTTPVYGLGFNARNEVAFGAELTDGRIVVLRARTH